MATLEEFKQGKRFGTDWKAPTYQGMNEVYETVIDAETVAQSVRDDADSGLFIGEQGEVGPVGPQGLPGKDAEIPQSELDKIENALQTSLQATTTANQAITIANQANFTSQNTFDLFNEFVNIFGNPITAGEFDALGLASQQFDNKQMTAGQFDIMAKTILGGI